MAGCGRSSSTFVFLLAAAMNLGLYFAAVDGKTVSDDELNKKMHTLFSVECSPYFDWQTVGMMQSYR